VKNPDDRCALADAPVLQDSEFLEAHESTQIGLQGYRPLLIDGDQKWPIIAERYQTKCTTWCQAKYSARACGIVRSFAANHGRRRGQVAFLQPLLM
jgi:hypothetical protein